jgi:hypothetical protein
MDAAVSKSISISAPEFSVCPNLNEFAGISRVRYIRLCWHSILRSTEWTRVGAMFAGVNISGSVALGASDEELGRRFHN